MPSWNTTGEVGTGSRAEKTAEWGGLGRGLHRDANWVQKMRFFDIKDKLPI